jgi:hypothetical protein
VDEQVLAAKAELLPMTAKVSDLQRLRDNAQAVLTRLGKAMKSGDQENVPSEWQWRDCAQRVEQANAALRQQREAVALVERRQKDLEVRPGPPAVVHAVGRKPPSGAARASADTASNPAGLGGGRLPARTPACLPACLPHPLPFHCWR